MILAATLLAIAASSSSSVPDAPPIQVPVVKAKTHNFNRYDYALYAGVVAYRVGDYYTTERVLATGGHEVELPQAFVASKPGFAAYSLGMAALQISSSVYLHRHGHAKMARIVDAVTISAGVATDARNATQVK